MKTKAYFCKTKELFIKAIELESGKKVYKLKPRPSSQSGMIALFTGMEVYEDPKMPDDIIELREKVSGKLIERYKIPLSDF